MPSPSEARRIEKQEIAKRYRRKRARDLSAIRLGDLNRLLTDIAGGERLPDTPAARVGVMVAAHHLASLPQDLRRSIPAWISLRAPWMTMGETAALVLEVVAKPRRWKAARLGWLLKLTDEQRRRLRITTIAPYDVSPAERAKRRKADSRARARASRRRKGAIPRAQYLAATVKPKPWIAAGVSRATWYRRRMRP